MPRYQRPGDRRSHVPVLLTVVGGSALIVAAVTGIWYATREKPGVDARIEPDSPPVIPNPKKTPRADRPEPKAPDATPRIAEPAKPPTFEEALARVAEEGKAIRAEFDAEYPQRVRLLTEDERYVVDKILSRKSDRRERFTAGDLRYLHDHKMAKWVWAHAVAWACADPVFEKAARYVWERSPKMRKTSALFEMAIQWGQSDRVSNLGLLQFIEAVEKKGRELTREELNLLIAFTGEEYYINRP
jgi:hypothetical protein